MAVNGPPPTRSGRIPNRRTTANTTPTGIEDKNVDAALRRMSEVIERREGRLGDKSEASVTWADLQSIGMVKPVASGVGGGRYTSANGDDSFKMFMCPSQGFSAPTNLRLFVNISTVLLNWDIAASCSVGAFEVWRSDKNNINTAKLLATVFGTGYADVGLPTPEAGKTRDYFYWVRALSVDGVASTYSSATGLKATIHASITDQMAALDEKISKRLLDTGLTKSIDVIDGSDKVKGTLAWHIRELKEADVGNVKDVKQWVGYRAATAAEKKEYGTDYVTAVMEQGFKIKEVDGKLNSTYQLKIDNGKVAGFQLVNNEGQPSAFDIWADEFSISSPAYTETTRVWNLMRFRFDTRTTNYPASTVSPFRVAEGKVWINEAIIDVAKINVATIDDGYINNAKITAAEIYGNAKINGDIYSSSYSVSTNNGWKLFSDGKAHFGKDVTFGGTLNVGSSDKTGSVSINNQGITVKDSAGRTRIRIGKL
jgi:hypothetical protein